MGLCPTYDPAQDHFDLTFMFKVHQACVFRLMAWNLVKQHQRTLNTNLGWMIVYLYSLCFWSRSNAPSKFLEKSRRTPTPTKPKREELQNIFLRYQGALINDSDNLKLTPTCLCKSIPLPLSHFPTQIKSKSISSSVIERRSTPPPILVLQVKIPSQ